MHDSNNDCLGGAVVTASTLACHAVGTGFSWHYACVLPLALLVDAWAADGGGNVPRIAERVS